jgi:hypothetical protein
MLEIGPIEAHEGLTRLHRFTNVDQPLVDFSPDAEADIALHSRGDDPCKTALRCGGRENIDYADQLVFGSRIALSRRARGEAEQRDGHNDDGES